MKAPTVNPAPTLEHLRDRIVRLLGAQEKTRSLRSQLSLELALASDSIEVRSPKSSITELLNFLTDSLPTGDIYLYGGVLRDIAFYGKRGFSSDLDLVVEGDWAVCSKYLSSLGARRNKFGGFRLEVAGWPIDIWSAPKTWAFEQGLIEYRGISSLIRTTILNWDAILMNWRTRQFICGDHYLKDVQERRLDVVFEENPNPLGMAVRVLRHFYSKEALQITVRAATYMANCVSKYSLKELRSAELASYRNTIIDDRIFRFFEEVNACTSPDMRSRFLAASSSLRQEMEIQKLV